MDLLNCVVINAEKPFFVNIGRDVDASEVLEGAELISKKYSD